MISEFTSFLHRSASANTDPHIDIDIDTLESQHLIEIKQRWFGGGSEDESSLINAFVALIRTRNGYHLVLNRKLLTKKSHHNLHGLLCEPKWKFTQENRIGQEITQTYISINKGGNIPLPDTYQGGFKVHFVSLREFMK